MRQIVKALAAPLLAASCGTADIEPASPATRTVAPALASAPTTASSVANPRALDPAMSFRRATESTADNILSTSSKFIQLAQYREDDAAKQIAFTPGQLDVTGLGLDDNSRFALVVEILLRARLLSTAFKGVGDSAPRWREEVAALESLAQDLSNVPDTAFEGSVWEQKAKEPIDRIRKAVGERAKKLGYGLSSEPGRVPASKGFIVPISTTPASGTVRLIMELQFRKEQMKGTAPPAMSWTTVLGAQATLMGRYRFWVTWPDGKASEGMIEVDSATPLTFSPGS